MRWSAVAPVTWPSQRGFDAWWRSGVADAIGDLDHPTELFEPDGDEVELVSGEHLHPGAVYRWIPPEGDVVGTAAWGIGGRHDRRDLYLEYQESADPRRGVVVRVDGLDACGSATVTSTLKHLAAKASFQPDRDRLLDIEVTLDWLLVALRASVAPTEQGEQLRVSLRVVGRGLWKPVIAPLLVPLGVGLRHLLTSEVEEAADRLTHLDEDPRGDGAPERELARIRAGAELIRTRLHEVVSTVDARPFWRGRGRRALEEAFAALPAGGSDWPTVSPAMTFGDNGRWWGEEQWIFDILIDRNPWRRKRHQVVDEQVDLWMGHQEALLEQQRQVREEHEQVPALSGGLDLATAEDFNTMMDLSWLASPWSTVRHLARNSAEEGGGEDLPPLETDEDVRRFVTDLVKEL